LILSAIETPAAAEQSRARPKPTLNPDWRKPANEFFPS
jgi:hypothetical protein